MKNYLETRIPHCARPSRPVVSPVLNDTDDDIFITECARIPLARASGHALLEIKGTLALAA